MLIFFSSQKSKNNQNSFRGETWNLQAIIKGLNNQSSSPNHNHSSSSYFPSTGNNSSGNNQNKKGSGERHICQICEKVGHQASRCYVLHD